MLERMWRKGNPLTLLVGMQTSTATKAMTPARADLSAKLDCFMTKPPEVFRRKHEFSRLRDNTLTGFLPPLALFRSRGRRLALQSKEKLVCRNGVHTRHTSLMPRRIGGPRSTSPWGMGSECARIKRECIY